jgi:hypothetical protein
VPETLWDKCHNRISEVEKFSTSSLFFKLFLNSVIMHLLTLYPNILLLPKLIVLLKKNCCGLGENNGISNACTRRSLAAVNLYTYRNYKSHIINKTNLQIFNIV